MDLRTRYGELELAELAKDASFISINTEYTDIILPVDQSMFYNVEIVYNGKTEIILPSSVLTRKESVVNKEEDIRKLEFKALMLAISFLAGCGNSWRRIEGNGQVITELRTMPPSTRL